MLNVAVESLPVLCRENLLVLRRVFLRLPGVFVELGEDGVQVSAVLDVEFLEVCLELLVLLDSILGLSSGFALRRGFNVVEALWGRERSERWLDLRRSGGGRGE